MSLAKGGSVSRQLESLWTSGTLTGLSDAQLVGRFAAGGGDAAEAAFRELVERHGPMVLGVCRQILRRPQDADDAFQATFLVLVRKARSIRVGDSLAPWLYGVAYRTAHRARVLASRYRTGEFEATAEVADSTPADAFEVDVRPLLHEELARLPEKYRAPIVLCHLEGKTHEEAAGLLSWPVGTVSGRLSRGRQLLRDRLERRGVSVSSTAIAARWLTGSQALLTPSLVDSTLVATARFAAAGIVSTSVLSLTQGVLRTMFVKQLKATSLVLVVVVTGTVGVAWAIRTTPAGHPPDPAQSAPAAPPRAEAKPIQRPADPSAGSPPGPAAPGSPRLVEEKMPKRPLGPYASDLANRWGRQPFIRSSSIIVAESPDHRSLRAISLDENKDWQTLTLPPGVTAIPMLSEDTAAPIFRGKAIPQIAAFSKDVGEWRTQPLRTPAAGDITPLIATGGAAYQIGNDVYAFSAFMGSWGAIHLEGEGKPQVSFSTKDITVLHGNHLYVFGLKQGHFSTGIEVNPRPFRRDAPDAKPAR